MPLEVFWPIYWTFVAFVFGAIVGSFLNVCVWRLPRGESLWHPPSHCPGCNHQLRMFPDMVPLLSQLWSRGKCRYCGQPFSWRYFWVEVFSAVTFAAIYVRFVVFGPTAIIEDARAAAATASMVFAACLITIFFIDLEHYVIPDGAVILAALAAVARDVLLIGAGARPLWQHLWGFPWAVPVPVSVIEGVLALWLLWQFAALATAALGREAMGAGDSLLMGAMGAMLVPWPLLVVAFLTAVALGTVGGLIGMFAAARQEESSPAGPEPAPDAGPSPATGGAADAGTAPDEVVSVEDEPPTDLPLELPGAGPDGLSAHRGTAEIVQPAEEEPGAPELPPSSRWGRLLTVLGSWTGVAALWIGASLYVRKPVLGIVIGLGLAFAAFGLISRGVRLWVTGDREWLPAMDEFFEEGEPGPRFIPFGPYLVAGTLVAMLFGHQIVEWYVTKFMMLPPGSLTWMGGD